MMIISWFDFSDYSDIILLGYHLRRISKINMVKSKNSFGPLSSSSDFLVWGFKTVSSWIKLVMYHEHVFSLHPG